MPQQEPPAQGHHVPGHHPSGGDRPPLWLKVVGFGGTTGTLVIQLFKASGGPPLSPAMKALTVLLAAMALIFWVRLWLEQRRGR